MADCLNHCACVARPHASVSVSARPSLMPTLHSSLFFVVVIVARDRVLMSNNSAARDHPVSLVHVCPLQPLLPVSLRIECRAVIALVHLSTTNFYSLSFLPSSLRSSSLSGGGRRAAAAATPYIIQSDWAAVAAALPTTAGEKDATEHYCQFPSFFKIWPRRRRSARPLAVGAKARTFGGREGDGSVCTTGRWMCVCVSQRASETEYALRGTKTF